VEGHSQRSDREFGRFLGYALASAFEVEHHLITAKDLSAIPEAEFVGLIAELAEIRKMIYALRARVDPRSPTH
jgi:four helix bundle protein